MQDFKPVKSECWRYSGRRALALIVAAGRWMNALLSTNARLGQC